MNEWKKVQLQSVAVIERNIVEASAIKAGTLYVGLENIQSGGEFSNIRGIGAGELASSKFEFTSKHLLYGKLRPYLAKIARPNFDGICSTDIVPVMPGKDINRDYLSHYLLQPSMVALANSRSSGANLPRLSPTALGELEITLPPLSEQKRIAEILDKADTLRAQRRAAIAQLGTITRSIFLDMFGDPIANPKKIVRKSLGEIAEWKSGGTPPRNIEEYFQGKIPWFSSGELGEMYVSESKEHISSKAIKSTSAKMVPHGSMMLGMYDTAALKASIARVDCSCNQAIAYGVIKRELIDPIYLYYSILLGKNYYRRLQRGVRQKNLNLSMVREITILQPKLELQREFTRKIQSIEELKSKIYLSIKTGDDLFDSLQYRVFRGEL